MKSPSSVIMKINGRHKMKFVIPKQLKNPSQFRPLEHQLAGALTPVTPRAGFAAELQAKLSRAAHAPTIGVRPAPTFDKSLVTSVAAIATGLLLMVSGFRAVVSVAGVIVLLLQFNRERKSSSTLQRPLSQ